MYLCNAFSLNMLSSLNANICVRALSLSEAKEILSSGFESAVGHADTAAVFATVLGTSVPMNRKTVVLQSGSRVIVGQYKGPRLAEGSTTLPEGATIEFCEVTIS